MPAPDLFADLLANGWDAVQSLIENEQFESLHFDFKTRAPKAHPGELEGEDRKVLGKVLSGFANAEGGVIIFGLTTYRRGVGDVNRLSKVQTAYLDNAEAFKRALQRVRRSLQAMRSRLRLMKM